MGRMEKYGKKRMVFFLTAVFTMLLAFDVFLCLNYYKEYVEQMRIAVYIVEEKPENNLDGVAAILKEAPFYKNKEGRPVLEEYGYFGKGENKYRDSFYQNCIETLVLSAVFFCATGLLFYYLERHWKKRERELLGEIENRISRFTKAKREMQEELTGILWEEGKETVHIAMWLEELKDYLHYIEEKAENESEETKSFVTDISHQLKNPVAALSTCLSILSGKNLSEEERQEFLKRAQQELKGLEDLLAALLNISKMEAGMIKLQKEEMLLFDTVLEAVNRVYPKASEKQVEIILEAGEGNTEEIRIRQDKKWLCEAFINILDNGIKYSAPGTVIRIRISKNVLFLRIEMEDEGIGIPKEERHKIFGRFYRGSAKEVKEESGTGVGLYLTRKIISMHKGTIAVTSGGNGKGSKFIIQLPFKE